MRITANRLTGQLMLILFAASVYSCGLKKEETPVIPPVTGPLSRDYIGYGVITSSFTHINSDPSDDSLSLGYIRRGSLVKIIRRQELKAGNVFQIWVLIDGEHYGWLKEEVMEIYSSESQAKTASETILR